MAIVNARLTTAQLDILTVPTDGSVDGYAITNILVCNTDGNSSGLDSQFKMYLIPNGSAKGVSTMVIKDLVLPDGETFTFDSERIVLSPGDKITFEAEDITGSPPATTNLTATVSYLDV